MRKTLIASALLAAFTLPSVAFAEEPAKEEASYTLTGNMTLASEYMYRGIAQTNRKPAIQGGIDFAHNSGVYLGTWASNISWLSDGNTDTSAPIEMDFYGGYKGAAGDITYDVGLLQYYYPGTYPDGYTSPNTLEGYGSLGYKWISVKGSYAFTNLFGWLQPDGSKTKGSYYLEANGAFELGAGFNLGAHLGYQNVKGFDDASYTDWKLGVTKDLVGFTWGLAYVGTNAKGEPGEPYRNRFGKDLGANRILFTVGKTL